MLKRCFTLFGCAVSLFIISVSLYAAGPAIPQPVLDWQNEAQNGIVKNDMAGAVEAYQKIQKAYPNTAYAADAQKQVVLAYLQTNHPDKVLTSLSEFSQKYSLQPGYLSQMGEIVNRMADANMASQAKEACQSLLERFGDNPEMLWILQRKSRCEIFMKTPDLADQTVKDMQQKYAAHPQYADALSWTAYEYRRMGFSAAAAGLYQSILSQNPPADIQLRCRSGLVLINLGLGDKDNAIKEAQQIKASIRSYQKYIQMTELEEAINALADTGQPGIAQEICQAAVEQFTDTPALLWIWQRKARCELFMHNLSLADETVRVMQQKYTSHPEYVDALNWTACEYRRMGYCARSWELYHSILALNPNEVVQLRSLAGLILSDVELESTAVAAKEAQQLKTSIQSMQKYVRITEVEDAINALTDAGQLDAAREICQTITDQFPDDPSLLWIWQRKARSEVFMKKVGLADESVKVMQQKYATHPEYTDALYWTAYEYRRMGFFARSGELYNSILALNPNETLQLQSIAGLIYSDLGLKDKANADKDIQQIKTSIQAMRKYVRITDVEDAINVLADAGHPEAAGEICQVINDHFQDDPSLLWIWQRKARCDVFLGKIDLADESVKVMRQKYTNHPEYADALSWTAYEYFKKGFYLRAKELYSEVLNHKPSEEALLRSITGIARIYIHQGEDTKVQEQINYLLTQFKNNPEKFASYVFYIGEEYYYLAHTNPLTCSKLTENGGVSLQKAVKVWQILLDSSLKTETIADAWYFSGVSYWKAGDIEQAMWCYTKLTEDWPEYKYNWSAQPYIGIGYEILRDQGYFTHEEIDSWIEESYKKTLNNYPDGCMAEEAKNGLDRLYKSKLPGQSVSTH